VTPVLLAFLDDRSRLCCHAQWYLAETAETFVHGLSQAMQKRGLPRALLTDNGAPMTAAETREGLERLTTPKGGRLRYVPLTIRLAAAFRDHRHLRCPNVLCQDDGQALTRQMVQYRVLRASRRAKLSQDGVHILRHTFCSHLAMRGAPPRAIQELAGHRELGMTQRYMHLSPAALDSAIRLLDQPFSVRSFGDILETGRVS
jgi:hypothetical protein